LQLCVVQDAPATRLTENSEAVMAHVAGLLGPDIRTACWNLGGVIKASDAPAAAIAAKGNFETLLWLREDGWRFSRSGVAANDASTHQLHHVLAYVLPEVDSLEVARDVLPAAVACGCLPASQLLPLRIVPMRVALNAAMEAGRADMVRWLVDEHNVPVDSLDSRPRCTAAKHGDLPRL
jgi:hypothetical protein